MRLVPGVRYEDTVESLGESFGTLVPHVSGPAPGLEPHHGGRGPGQRGRSKTNRMAQQINLDAIAEVKVLLNNYRAEYGRSGGAHIQIVSKSGDARLQGQPLLLRPPREVQRQQLHQQRGRAAPAPVPLQHVRVQPRAGPSPASTRDGGAVLLLRDRGPPHGARPGSLRGRYRMPTGAGPRGRLLPDPATAERQPDPPGGSARDQPVIDGPRKKASRATASRAGRISSTALALLNMLPPARNVERSKKKAGRTTSSSGRRPRRTPS